MPCLILDTSTEECIIALVEGADILDDKIFAHRNLLSKLLIPEIQALLQKSGLNPKNLNGIAVGIGPGSYTGTRLGVSVGKSLAFALKLPLKPFASPLAFLPSQDGAFAFLMPTRSGNCFVLKGTAFKTSVLQESIAIVPPEEISRLTQNADFLISTTPSEGNKKPVFTPRPNLQSLSAFLLNSTPVPQENVDILYLHTPF